MNEIIVNGIKYIEESVLKTEQYVIVRTNSAGVFAGYITKRTEKSVVMKDARRLWMWYGASSLSELAMKGVSRPTECKFPCEVSRVELFNIIEIIDCTEIAKNSIGSVPEWTSH